MNSQKEIVLSIEREGRTLTATIVIPVKLAEKIRTFYNDTEFKQLAISNKLEFGVYKPLIVQKANGEDILAFNTFDIYYYKEPLKQTLTFESAEKAKIYQEAIIQLFNSSLAPFLRMVLAQKKEVIDTKVSIDNGTVPPEFKLPSPEITLSDEGPLLITDSTGKTWVAQLRPTKRKNAYAEIKAALASQAKEKIEAIRNTMRAEVEAFKALAQQAIDDAKAKEQDARIELRNLKQKLPPTMLPGKLEDYLKNRIFSVPMRNTIAYFKEFTFNPEFLSYYDADTRSVQRARIPESLRQQIKRPMLAALIGTRVYLYSPLTLSPVQTYHSYSSGEVCLGTAASQFRDPTSITEANAMLDIAINALNTINGESMVSREPEQLPSFSDLLEAVKNENAHEEAAVWQLQEATA